MVYTLTIFFFCLCAALLLLVLLPFLAASLIFEETSCEARLASYMILSSTIPHNILTGKSAHRHFPYSYDLGQKKSVVNGTSIWVSAPQDSHPNSCVKSTLGTTLL